MTKNVKRIQEIIKEITKNTENDNEILKKGKTNH